MANVWKIGPRPGLWKNIKESKFEKGKKYVLGYALPYGFVAIGSAWVEDNFKKLIKQNKIRKAMELGWDIHKEEERTDKKLDIREKWFRAFAGVNIGDIMLQYLDFKNKGHCEVYVGKAILKNNESSPYYYIDNPDDKIFRNTEGIHYAPHRVKVTWDFKDDGMEFKKGKSFPAMFDGRYLGRRMIQIKDTNLESTIRDEKLKQYLRKKIHG